jgi:predicted AlkP superfamily phosphohydrolase/phosphomutase
MKAKKVAVIGLDCAPPQLVFDQWREDLPNLNKLMQRGVYGKLESSVPPITVPAWSSMMSSKDPGQLGFYGFRNRKDHSYDNLSFADSRSVQHDRVWDILSRQGKQSILIGVPQTYPPSPINGLMVTCFLTPSIEKQFTYPAELRHEVESVVGRYILDVENFRTDEKERILAQIYEMTDQRFDLANHFLRTREWDFFMMVEIGVDRIHHGFWKYHDPEHPQYVAGNEYEKAIFDYYVHVDSRIGELLEHFDDDTAIFVVSDHGAKRMIGGICVNEWLMQEGYLTLAEKPDGVQPIGKVKIDWSRTVAWGEGGYYSRIFMNVRGREPEGTVAPEEYEAVRDELIRKFEAITDPEGNNIGTRVFKPEAVYRECNGVPPDLIVYFGDLDWRSVGSVGLGSIHTFSNDTGPDDANHAQHGICILKSNGSSGGKELEGLHLMDIGPTVLDLLGCEVPGSMEGKVIGA